MRYGLLPILLLFSPPSLSPSSLSPSSLPSPLPPPAPPCRLLPWHHRSNHHLLPTYHLLVWFPNPLAAGSQMGTLSNHLPTRFLPAATLLLLLCIFSLFRFMLRSLQKKKNVFACPLVFLHTNYSSTSNFTNGSRAWRILHLSKHDGFYFH